MVADVSSAQALRDGLVDYQARHDNRLPSKLELTKDGCVQVLKWLIHGDASGESPAFNQRMHTEVFLEGTPAMVRYFHGSSLFGVATSFRPELMIRDAALFL